VIGARLRCPSPLSIETSFLCKIVRSGDATVRLRRRQEVGRAATADASAGAYIALRGGDQG
jgi:hypothetical protein